MSGRWLRWASLAILLLQTTSLVLLMRYSRTQAVEGPRYVTSTAVVTVEVVKIIMCCFFLFLEKECWYGGLVSSIKTEVFEKPRDTLKLVVPSGLYTIQNNLLYIALNNLNAATYQVTYQLKILTTAIFSVIMLNKKLQCIQWISLLCLTLGVTLVQLPAEGDTNSAVEMTSAQLIGLASVLAACLSSGFAGVYFEKILKSSDKSIWIRNIQLALFGILFGFGGVIFNDLGAVLDKGFFQGYNAITWEVILLQAGGGLVVAVVIKYADNILKSFAASLSIIVSAVLSYYILGDFKANSYFLLGASIVILSTFMYAVPLQVSKPVLSENVDFKQPLTRVV